MNKKKNELNIDKFMNFLEELAWLLDNYKGLKIEECVLQVKDLISEPETFLLGNGFSDQKNKSSRALVGIFPELFQNRSFFPTNQSIIEFANEVFIQKSFKNRDYWRNSVHNM